MGIEEFVVFQVKFHRKKNSGEDPHKWLLDVLDKELPKVKKLIPKGAKAYYLLTNVKGTAHLDSGSIDKANDKMSKILCIPSQCWWRDDINRRLDNAWDLKWCFPNIMTGKDMLRLVIEAGFTEDRERRLDAMKAFLRSQYRQDQDIRFKQVELQNRLLDLFVDVPIREVDPYLSQWTRKIRQRVDLSTNGIRI